MKRICICLLLIACFSQFPGAANSEVSFELLPNGGYGFGHATYVMDFLFTDEFGDPNGVKSELEFPIDGPFFGLAARMKSASYVRHPWSIAGGVRFNLSDPGGTMYDTDWAFNPVTGANTETFSYTESDVEGKAIEVTLDARYQFTVGDGAALGAILACSYFRIDQDVVGFTGWAYDNTGTRINFTDGRLGITYLAWYFSPHLGLYGELPAFGSGVVTAAVATGPTWAKDIDDHVLRFKEAIADGLGLGVTTSLDLRLPLSGQGGSRPFVELGGYMRYQKIDGDQTQTWYADETDSQGEVLVPAGTSISGLPHEFTTLQYGVIVRFGLTLGDRRR